ncbi:MAG: Asp-tRNA(Asn)/Glu-tRNA(Gln) amidotransferase subunit GatA [Chloracidobacterium sp.]|nr:Asp-tRNA(Asn)/Glu-tRNA(Gln) amidotransferase subunit GatA [Chloracidobacterium sp.]MDW8216534.1 Asp-tRNA(Asn)/Glu-tRNA(Gln) amidotransferase subunit GatA [Acidobacteriota bacterium]
MNLLDFDIDRLHAALRARDCSATEVCRAALAAIEQRNPDLNALLSTLPDRALEQAAMTDARIAAGEPLRPLEGVPIVVKDNQCLAGTRTTCASRMLANYTATYTATAVARLEAAGAVIVGKANLDEFAMGSSNENSAFGPVRHPLDPTRVPGGSSGGSAAAVAAGLCLAATGSDTGGSIRQPAAFCGIVGVKPTYGRVSRYGLVAFGSSLDQIGPMTRTVRDAARMLGVMAGYDEHDATSSLHPVPDYLAELSDDGDADLRGWRIGVAQEAFGAGLDAEVEAAVRTALKAYERLGARLVEVSLPHLDYAIADYYIIAMAEASANLARFDGVRYGYRAPDVTTVHDLYALSREQGFGPEVKRRILLGTYALSSGYYDAYYLKAQKVRTLLRRDFDRAFEQCEVIVTPTTPTPAFKLGEKTGDPLQMYLSDIYTVTLNLAGVPGMSLPCGKSVEGLPIGLQIIAPAFEESRMFRAGRMLERVLAL